MDKSAAAELSDIVGSIYDCVLDPGLWSSTLLDLRRHMHFHTAVISALDVGNRRLLLDVSSGIEEPWRQRMSGYADDVVEQWGGRERVLGYPLGEPTVLSWVNPIGLTRANRYFAEWAEPQGLADLMAIGLARDAAIIATVAFGRHREAGEIRAEEVAAGRLFAPHLLRAVTISHLLEASVVRAAGLASVLDGLSVGVLLVDADLRLVHANGAGERALATGAPLRLRAGAITAANGVAAALAVAVAYSSGGGSGIGARGLGVPARDRNGAEVVLHVLPLGAGGARPQVLPGAVAAIFIAPAVAPRRMPIEAVARLFDLTPAEARVLEQVAAGLTNTEVAASLGVAVSTVRTHLLHIFDKTQTHRQAELVALLASFSLPLAS